MTFTFYFDLAITKINIHEKWRCCIKTFKSYLVKKHTHTDTSETIASLIIAVSNNNVQLLIVLLLCILGSL